MPGEKWKRSLKNPRQYEALRKRKGMSKQRAAMISNGVTPGTTVKAARKRLRRKRTTH